MQVDVTENSKLDFLDVVHSDPSTDDVLVSATTRKRRLVVESDDED